MSTYPLALSPCSAAPEGAVFLKIPVGARAAGMGSAFTALADDASALYWNPAGLAHASRVEIMASHTQWIADTRQDFAAFNLKITPWTAAAAGYLSFTSDPIDKRGEQGQKLGTFTAQDRALYASCAIRVGRWIAAGASLKNIEQRLDHASAQGRALDLGVQLKPHRKISLGATLQNLGTEMQFIKQSYALPAVFRAGMGFHLSPGLTLVAEGKKSLLNAAQPADWAAGLEYNILGIDRSYFWSPVSWRLGYLSSNVPGIGVGMNFLGTRVDYALASVQDLGLTHRISLSLRLGTPPSSSSLPAAKPASRPQPSFHYTQDKLPQKKTKKATTTAPPTRRMDDPRVFEWIREKGASQTK